jgi:metal transporter CNNM
MGSKEEEQKSNSPHKRDHKRKDKDMGLHDEQANLMISAIEIQDKKVIELMIPIKNIFMFDYDEPIDKFNISLLIEKGYSRIPVYSNHNKNDIVGLLRIKQLIGVDVNQNRSLRQLGIDLRKPLVISPKATVLDLLREFRKGKSHMAFITEQVEDLQAKFGLTSTNSVANSLVDNSGFLGKRDSSIKILGIVTLEDIIEKMINLDILDEDDYEKLSRSAKRGGGFNNLGKRGDANYSK